MRILVDNEVLAHPSTPEYSFWKAVLPELLLLPGEHQFYLLQRSPADDLRNSGIATVNAPPFDFKNSIIEDRRLAALNAELQTDAFVSTFYTTAGASVKSVFIAIDQLADTVQANSQIRTAGIRAAKLSSVQIAVSEQAATDLRDLTTPTNLTQIMAGPLNSKDAAETIAKALQSIPSRAAEDTRSTEELVLQRQLQQIRINSENLAEKLWRRAKSGGPLPVRIGRAIISVQRYPEFIRRFQRAVASRL